MCPSLRDKQMPSRRLWELPLASDLFLPGRQAAFEIRRLLPPGCERHVEVFQGGHEWCPADFFDRAMDWMENEAFLSKAAVAGPCRLLGIEVKAEPMSPAGYHWFFRLTQARAEAAQSPAAKYRQLERLSAPPRDRPTEESGGKAGGQDCQFRQAVRERGLSKPPWSSDAFSSCGPGQVH